MIIRALGPTEYERTWRSMQAFTSARGAATPDELWLTEHPPIYTLGLAGRRLRRVERRSGQDGRPTALQFAVLGAMLTR